MKRILAIVVLTLLAVSANTVLPATAQTDATTVDPRLSFSNVEVFRDMSGNLVVELTPERPWVDGMITDLFSWFFAVDISNETDVLGGFLQSHDGVVTANGLINSPGTTKEQTPTILIGNGGRWIRLVFGAVPPADGELMASGASMVTPESDRITFPGFSMGIGRTWPEIDPFAGAVKIFRDKEFVEITDPVPDTRAPTTTTQATTVAPTTVAPTTDAPPTTLSDEQLLALDADFRAQEDLAPDATGFKVSLLVIVLTLMALLLMFLMWLRARNRPGPTIDDEDEADPPEDLPDDSTREPPEDPDDFIERVL